ncbi:MAG: GH3 auxin-responsive promoter family protein [Chloroflexota bacterium]|nr:GH3 auxin-responsive promoter family protein [Lentimicrobium sp.]
MPILGSIIKGAIEFPSKIPFEKIRKAKPAKQQKDTLRKLISKAQYTALGEAYGFSDLLKEKDIVNKFKTVVPINDYNSIHQKWWYRTLHGESFVAWPGKVKYFALSSGTSEATSKYIPVTPDMLKAIKKTSIRQIFSLAKYDFPNEFFEKGILMLGGSTHLQFNGTYYEGDLSGITAGNIPFWFQHFYKPGKRISKERDWTTKLDEIVKNASNWDIGVIVGVPAWLQILMERIIAYYNVKTIHDVWPNLSIYVHGGVSFAPYQKTFEKLLAKPLTYIETYLASEGFIAYQSRPHTDGMQLVLDNGLFFEFIEFNSDNFDEDGNVKPNAKTITVEDVKEGMEYALLISSCAGAWRYMIGDTVKFTSKEKSEIVITGRIKHFLNLCGEHLSQENMNRAIQLLEEQQNIAVPEFTVSGIKHESMFAHKWYLGVPGDISDKDSELIKKQIDQNLKDLNDDYRVERIAAIRDVIVEILPLELFYNYMKLMGKEGGQNKFPRVIKKDQLKRWEDYLNSNYRNK